VGDSLVQREPAAHIAPAIPIIDDCCQGGGSALVIFLLKKRDAVYDYGVLRDGLAVGPYGARSEETTQDCGEAKKGQSHIVRRRLRAGGLPRPESGRTHCI
jgi:hypothetical protein